MTDYNNFIDDLPTEYWSESKFDSIMHKNFKWFL